MQHGAGDVVADPWFVEVDWNKLLRSAPHLSEVTTDGDTSACVSLLSCCLLSKEAWTLNGYANARCLDSRDTMRIRDNLGQESAMCLILCTFLSQLSHRSFVSPLSPLCLLHLSSRGRKIWPILQMVTIARIRAAVPLCMARFTKLTPYPVVFDYIVPPPWPPQSNFVDDLCRSWIPCLIMHEPQGR